MRCGSRSSASTRRTPASATRRRRRRCAARASSARWSSPRPATRGRRGRRNGVVGSPGAARAALTAGATEAGAGVPRVTVTIGGRELAGATALGGRPAPGKLAGPVTSTDTAALLRGRPSVAGRVALVRAGDNPVAQATAAAGAGARAVILADPRDRPLPMMPSGRVARPRRRPHRRRREGRAEGEGRREGDVRPREGGPSAAEKPPAARAAPAPFSSRGPSFDGSLKPDVLAEGAAVTPEGIVAGTAVAAARMAVRAARLARQRPAETRGRDQGGARARRDRGGGRAGRPRRSRSARSS